MQPCIVAMGGGAWGSEPDNPLLDNYILSLARSDHPRLCFIPTASGDSDQYITRFYDAFRDRGCVPTHLPLFHRTIADLWTFLLSQDILWIGGGNTANMLAVWKLHGVIEILREAWQQGIVLCGSSAGSICWYDCGVTDSYGKTLQPIHGCLGFLSGSHCPHYDGEPQRRPCYHQMIAAGDLPAGIAADDGAGVKYLGTEEAEIISSRPDARVWRISRNEDGTVSEVEVVPRYLGDG